MPIASHRRPHSPPVPGASALTLANANVCKTRALRAGRAKCRLLHVSISQWSLAEIAQRIHAASIVPLTRAVVALLDAIDAGAVIRLPWGPAREGERAAIHPEELAIALRVAATDPDARAIRVRESELGGPVVVGLRSEGALA